MKKNFPGYYRPSEAEFAELWENGIFIFDTNAILNLYRYPQNISKELIGILKIIAAKNRLWIPYQVALEYQNNRLNVIADQIKKYSQVKTILDKTQGNLKEEFNKLKLEKRHSFIDSEKFLDKVDKVFNKFLHELEKFKEKQPNVNDHD